MDEKILKFFKFILFSLSAGILQIVLFLVLSNLTDLPWAIIYLVPLFASIVWNFLLNYKYTFKSNKNKLTSFSWVILYYTIYIPSSLGITSFLVETCSMNELLIELTFMLVNFTTEYLYQSIVIYKSPVIPDSWKRNKIAVSSVDNQGN